MRTSLTISLFILYFHSISPPDLYSQDVITYKKLYLHTDREIYFPGDTVWFKGYYLDANSQQFVSGIYSVYSELIDEEGNTVQSQVLPIVNGIVAGNLTIPDSLETGEFMLRAYTDYQRSQGVDLFFRKTLKVFSMKNGAEEIVESRTERRDKIDLAFLPEGGYLLEGQSNVVGIKVIDESGKGISVQGKILTGDGKIVSNFETRYRGMDTIHFTPQQKQSYRVEIETYPEFDYEISDVRKEGIKLEYVSESRYELLFRVTANSKQLQGNDFYFAITHRGQVIYQQGFFQGEKNIPIKINRSILPGGINRFVLLDDQFKPISERLLFVRKEELHRIDIRSDKAYYHTRGKVQLELIDELEMNGGSFSSLSIAVVDERSLGEKGPEMNIQSWLLIDSELKGNIECPSDYFKDDEAISSDSKLDLLMLTHGWSKYIWNEISETDKPLDLNEEEGFSLSGKVIKNYSKHAVVNGKVDIILYNNEYFLKHETRTDSEGIFSFDYLTFVDTASVYLQAWNEKGKSFSRVEIHPLFKDGPTVLRTDLPKADVISHIPKELQNLQYLNEKALQEYIMKTGSFFIEEVEVHAKKGDGIDRRYGYKPSTSLKVTMADFSYPDVFKYLQGRVAGLTVSYIQGDYGLEAQIRIRQFGSTYGSTNVLFLLNGMPVSKEVIQYLPLCDVDVIDVLKSLGETAIFGITGANGVIAVYTKRGMSDEEYNANPVGIISEKICGYSAYREFYSPAYTPENLDAEKPDHRVTLYWNPYITTENGKASLSFFTSDDKSGYKIFIEGITQSGEICLGTAELVVD